MKHFVIVTVFALMAFFINAQDLKIIKNAYRCKSAIEISTLSKFGPTGTPKEVKVKSGNNIFERIQYPVWYRFTIAKDGVLLFDIIPIDPKDNYDFLLYKLTNKSCDDIKSGKIEAIRTNFSRSNPALQGKTGLSVSGKPESYSKGIEVKKGAQYYLALNNMYKGKGHTIVFTYLENFKVEGKITDIDNGESLNARVYWTNMRNDETTVDKKTNKKGEYKLKVSVSTEVHRFPKYLLWAYADNYFIEDTIIASKDLDSLENNSFNFKLHKLKKGINSFLPRIYFRANSTDIDLKSFIDLKTIYKLLELNTNLQITLEGHSNGLYPSTEVDDILSTDRAEKVKKWLVEKGIDASRLKTKGYGSNKMIYPYAQNAKEEGANRRVEIFINKL